MRTVSLRMLAVHLPSANQRARSNASHIKTKQFTEDIFGMKHADIWPNFFIVLAYIVGFRLLALVFLRFVNSQKR